MELILNLAWALCSIGLVWTWARRTWSGETGSGRAGSGETGSRHGWSRQRWAGHRRDRLRGIPRTTQLLALAMVVVLLLPVISLSDDLMAIQAPAETDSCVRRALHASDGNPSVVPSSMAMPEPVFDALATGSQEFHQTIQLASPPSFQTRSLDSRPPPQA